MSNLFERLVEISSDNGYNSINDFAVNGLKYNSSEKINRLRDGTKKPSFEILKDISNKFENLNLRWLVTGKGSKYLTQHSAIREQEDSQKNTQRGNPDTLVKFYDTDFIAADAELIDEGSGRLPAYTMDIPEFNGCVAFRTYNSSMEKLIYTGDIVFAKKENDWQTSLEYGQIFVIVCKNNRTFLKYIRKAEGKEKTHFLLRSENAQEFDDFLLPKESIRSVWLVYGWLKKRA